MATVGKVPYLGFKAGAVKFLVWLGFQSAEAFTGTSLQVAGLGSAGLSLSAITDSGLAVSGVSGVGLSAHGAADGGLSVNGLTGSGLSISGVESV